MEASRPPPRIVANDSPRTRNIAAARGAKANRSAASGASRACYGSVLRAYEQNSIGLLFCVNKYPRAKTGEVKLKDLDCAVADGRAAAAMLRGQGFGVTLFSDTEVTKDAIDRALGNVMRKFPFKSPTIGRLYIMFAGHGLRDEASGSSVFCCHDYNEADAYMTSYPLDELKKKLLHVGIKHQCIHLDCCHAGGIFLGSRARAIDYNVVAHAEKPVVQAITAVTADEEALEAGGNGIFTKHLCEEIEKGWIFDRWGKDVVTLTQVFAAVREKVTSDARGSNGKMTPMHKDILAQHLKEQCAGEVLFFRPGMTSEAWTVEETVDGGGGGGSGGSDGNNVAEARGATATVAAAAVRVPEISPSSSPTEAVQRWLRDDPDLKIRSDLSTLLGELHVGSVVDLGALDAAARKRLVGALKKPEQRRWSACDLSAKVAAVRKAAIEAAGVATTVEAWLDAVGSVTDARAVRAWLDESGYLEEDLKDILVMDEEEQAALAAAIGTPAAGGLVRDALRAPGEKAAREKAAREKAAREKAAREKAAKEKAAREKAATEKAWADLAGVIGSDLATKLRGGATEIDLDANTTKKKMGDAGVAVLAKVLPQCTALTKLELRKNEITHAGVAVLANVLPQCPALSYLSLSKNQIGDSGCVALSNVLPQCPALSKLSLYGNQIGDSGCVALSNVLPQCPALSYLDLGGNQIGDSGGVALSNVLPQCPALSQLYLSDNQIGDSGCVALSNVLPQCPALSILRLYGNPFGPSVRSKLKEMSNTVQNRNGDTIKIST